MTKMIPPVPTSAVMMPTPKQKIGFSIESIVGNDATTTTPTAHTHTNDGGNSVSGGNDLLNNSNNMNSEDQNSTHSTSNGPSSPPQTPPTTFHALDGIANHSQSHILSGHRSNVGHQMTIAQQQALHHHLLLQQQQQQLHQHHHQQHVSSNSQKPDITDIIQRLHNSAAAAAHLGSSNGSFCSPQTPLSAETEIVANQQSAHTQQIGSLKRVRSPANNTQNPAQRHQPPHTPPKSVSPQSSQPSPPPPQAQLQAQLQASLPQPSPSSIIGSGPCIPQHYAKPVPVPAPAAGHPSIPILVPGVPPANIVRPFPVGPVGLGTHTSQQPQQGMPDIKALPPYINAPPELPPHQHNPHLLAAAQFQMAAALQAGHVLGPAAAAAAAAGLPPHAGPFITAPGMPRDSYPLYPWLLSRHGRIFPHRFPGNFLLQPFRKPKRIRTAFSPSQLLKLEHAFESNQYVVGAERKALAQALNLSETQVKVWFQNRRTKHKRMQQEDEKGGNSSERNSQSASCDEDDDELIDMEMDDCPSDDEAELDASQ